MGVAGTGRAGEVGGPWPGPFPGLCRIRVNLVLETLQRQYEGGGRKPQMTSFFMSLVCFVTSEK